MTLFMLVIGLLAPPIDSGEVIIEVHPADAVIRLDGALVAPGQPVWIKAGVHRLEVTRSEHRPHRQQFVLDAGGRARFDVRLEVARVAPAAPTSQAPAPRRPAPWVLPGQGAGVVTDSVPRSSRLRPVGIAMFITALVTGMATGIVGIIMKVKASRFEDAREYTRKVELRDDTESLVLATNVLLGVTTAFATTGFILFMADGRRGPRGQPAPGLGFRGTF